MANKIFPIGHPDSAGWRSHVISTREAAAMVRAYHEPRVAELQPFRHISFHADAVKHVLAQEGAVAIRYALAERDSAMTLVGFAVNEDGEVVGTEALDNGHPCPPWC